MSAPAVSVVVPTRNRARYLEVALASLAAQRVEHAYEVLVVDDGSGDDTPAVADRAGVRLARHERPRGANAARNTGIAQTRAPLVALIDDDVRAPARWLAAHLEGAARHDWAEALGGPIRASLEGPSPRMCGREQPPITTLDLGDHDREAELVWSANMLVRRSAAERVGGFDETIFGIGEEEEWQLRLHAGGGRIAYVPAAWLEHRRVGADARLRRLARAQFGRGRSARAHDRRKGSAPALTRELRDLAGAGWHTVQRRCPQGLIMGAHSAGRLTEALRSR